MKLQDVLPPCSSRADSSNVLSIDLCVEETVPANVKQSKSGLPEWKWRISALNTGKIKRKSIRSEPNFRQAILASKTNAAAPGAELRLENLLRNLGLWNTDILDDSRQNQPSGAILINNLSTALNRILTHPLVVKAHQDWDLGQRVEELKLSAEVHSLIGLFGQIWIPERESTNIFGSLYQDPFVGPELKRLFFAPRPFLVSVGFYVGNPVPNHQPVMFRSPTQAEEDDWTEKTVKNPVFAFNVHILRENGGRSVPGAGFRPDLFRTVFEIDPDLEGPDGRPINLFAPLVNPLKAPPPRPILRHCISPPRPPPTNRYHIGKVSQQPTEAEDSEDEFHHMFQLRVNPKLKTREAPSSTSTNSRYSGRNTRPSRVTPKVESLATETPSRVMSRELRSRMVYIRIDDEEE